MVNKNNSLNTIVIVEEELFSQVQNIYRIIQFDLWWDMCINTIGRVDCWSQPSTTCIRAFLWQASLRYQILIFYVLFFFYKYVSARVQFQFLILIFILLFIHLRIVNCYKGQRHGNYGFIIWIRGCEFKILEWFIHICFIAGFL